MALIQSSGVFAIATGATKPTHISVMEAADTLTSGTVIPVIEVQDDMVFECTNSASLSGVNIGQKVTLHASNGCQVTGTKTSGVATIVAKDGDGAGSRVLVRFD